jgi:hypothetical protein
MRFMEIVGRGNPNDIDVRVLQEIVHRGVAVWAPMPLRERARVLNSRTGGANKNLSGLLESRRKDPVSETARADQSPSQADQVLHRRDSKRTLTVKHPIRVRADRWLVQESFELGELASFSLTTASKHSRGVLQPAGVHRRELVIAGKANGIPGVLVEHMELIRVNAEPDRSSGLEGNQPRHSSGDGLVS